MPQALISLGYAGAFLVSFLSSTLIPLTAEVALVPLLALGYSPWLLFGSSLAGSYSGALLSYAIGRSGSGLLLDRLLRISPEAQQRAKAVVQRWGTPALFFSWLPIVGDPLALVGGVMHVPLAPFTGWVVLGRGLRLALVILIAQRVLP